MKASRGKPIDLARTAEANIKVVMANMGFSTLLVRCANKSVAKSAESRTTARISSSSTLIALSFLKLQGV